MLLPVSDAQLLRPQAALEGGVWRRVVPKEADLAAVGIPSEEAAAAIKEMAAMPLVSAELPERAPSDGQDDDNSGQSVGGVDLGVKKDDHGVGGEDAGSASTGTKDQNETGTGHGQSEDLAVEGKPERRRPGAGSRPSNADAPPGATPASGPLARPQRNRKSRVVFVRGHPVLKENMYNLTDLDTMAWQRAHREGKIVAESAPPDKKARRPLETAAAPPKLPSGPSAEQVARQDHNTRIRRDAQDCEVPRARYLLSHIDKLRPFITQQVEARIRQVVGQSQEAAASRRLGESIEQPEQITAVLREYQLVGLKWLVEQFDRGVNAILADEMGLGKTLQTIAFLAYLKFVRGVHGPHLVVVPLSVLTNWVSEFRRWCPDMRVVRLHSSDVEERKRLIKEVLTDPTSFDVAVTTYEMVNSPHFGQSLQHKLVWRYLVLDEAHKLKNSETRVSDGARHIARQHVLMLTGTPIHNNLHELFALLSFMYPDVFTDAHLFDKCFDLDEHKVDTSGLDAAHYLLRPFMLRRLKEEVEVDLPPKLETRICCPLSEMQTFWYRRLLSRDLPMLQGLERTGDKGDETVPSDSCTWQKAMNLLMQLRKVCNHPFMFPDAEPDFDGQSVPEELVTGSGKMMVLHRLLPKLKQKGHRVVLFSQFKIMLDIIEDYLRDVGYKYRRLDGSTNRIQRVIDITQFNKPGSDIFIFLLSTRAGGLGVNLQTADTCILFDSDWNPQWDLQAMARVHRIGQTRPVHTYRLVTEGTVEERVQRRAEAKLFLDQMVNRGSTSNAEQLEGLTKGEVLSMLRFGADRIFRNDAGEMPSDQELDRIIDRSRMTAELRAQPTGQQQQGQQQQGQQQQGQQQPPRGQGPAQARRRKSAATAPQRAHDGVASAGPSCSSGGSAGVDAVGVAQGASGDGGDGVTTDGQDVQPGAGAGVASGSGAAGPSGVVSGQSGAAAEPSGTVATAVAEAGSLNQTVTAAGPSGTVTIKTAEGTCGTSAGALVGGAAEPEAAGGHFMAGKHSALEFDAEAPPLDTFTFMGVDYRSLRAGTLRDIGSEYWAGKKRERKERLMVVDGFEVLKENNYTMKEGMLHAPGQERGKQPQKSSKRQRAGIDYDHTDVCLACWGDSGTLLCCDHCPAAFHPKCIGMTAAEVTQAESKRWTCPHHRCTTCSRNTSQAGGLLFRCEMCENAFCEDDLPSEHQMVGECELFQALGQLHPSGACFILCSKHCSDKHRRLQPSIQKQLRAAAKASAAREKKAAAEAAAKASAAAAQRMVLQPALQAVQQQGTATVAGRPEKGKRKAPWSPPPPTKRRQAANA